MAILTTRQLFESIKHLLQEYQALASDLLIRLHKIHTRAHELQRQLAAAEAQVQHLLRPAAHDPSCNIWRFGHTNRFLPCTCGLGNPGSHDALDAYVEERTAELHATLLELHKLIDFEQELTHEDPWCPDDPQRINRAFRRAYQLLNHDQL